MNPDKEIVNWWLNKKGFFTLSSIKVDKNRVIDIIAIKLSDAKVARVMHIEISSSISYGEIEKRNYMQKFVDKSIVAKVKEIVKEYVGANINYEKVLIIGQSKLANLENITVFNFSDILAEVFKELDKQNYPNPVIRTMQLIKYQLMADPKSMAEMINEQGDNQTFSQNTRDEFFKELMKHKTTKKILSKSQSEEDLIEIIKNSTINRPERLAKIIEEQVLGKKSRKKFLKSFDKEIPVPKEVKEVKKKKDQQLSSFFS